MSDHPDRIPGIHDYFKTIAVILMFADHFGEYIDPSNLWWRAIGRLCVPIWFFLIGYARSRRLPPLLIGGALGLAIFEPLLGFPLVPLNMLAGIVLVRLTLTPLMRLIGASAHRLYAVLALMALFCLTTPDLWEYGAMAYPLAICGYLVRNRQAFIRDNDPIPGGLCTTYVGFTWALFIYYSKLTFAFTTGMSCVIAAGCGGMFLALGHYMPQAERRKIPEPRLLPAGLLNFCGRHTLEIYIVHLTILQLIYNRLYGCLSHSAFCIDLLRTSF